MARYSERENAGIYELAAAWRDACLLGSGSLLWPSEQVSTGPNLARFKACVIDKPDVSAESFEQKFQKQLEGETEQATKLACEILLVYFLFTAFVGRARKRKLIEAVASWKKLTLGATATVFAKLLDGIGGTGQAYITRRSFELSFIAKVAACLLAESATDRQERKVAVYEHNGLPPIDEAIRSCTYEGFDRSTPAQRRSPLRR